MIKKIKGKYIIFSHTTGRKLSKPYASKSDALKRMRQIKFFGGQK